MIEITDITIRQYSTHPQPERYNLLACMGAKNTFAGHSMDIQQMPWANVKYCLRLLRKVQSWESIQQLFEICFDVKEDAFWSASLSEFFQSKLYLLSEFESLAKREALLMASASADEALWQIAGADKLKNHADTLPLISLGKSFSMWPADVGRKPYKEVISLLLQLKIQGEVETEFYKLKNK